jgi:hypothetical protein
VVVMVATHTPDGPTKGLNWLLDQPFPFVVYTKGAPEGTPFNYNPPTGWK